MRITGRTTRLTLNGSLIRLRRTTGGVVEIRAQDDVELARGLGFAHAHDRLVQMMLVRMVGQGRLSECLRGDERALEVDRFMRRMGLARTARAEAESCPQPGRQYGEAYAEGVNAYLARYRLPWELRLAGYRPEPWSLADTLLTIHLMSFVGLAQKQQELEKFLIQAIRGGVSVERLQRLFAPHLDGLDESTVELIRRVKVFDPVLPDLVPFLSPLAASNNWAVAPARSASGHALQCNDPHLECNRLPAVWYECVLHTPDDYRIGIGMPGMPGITMGRTRSLSLGLTYGFMDMVDYFIEDCRGGCYRHGEQYLPLASREEVFHKKNGGAVRMVVFETQRGVLETDPTATRLEDGLYLSRAYSASRGGAAQTLRAGLEIASARSVREAQAAIRQIMISGNWAIADRDGNIGYQQSGLLPLRQHSGLYPLPGWEPEGNWRGLVAAEQLATEFNPPEGLVFTANDDRNQPGKPLSINMCQGPDRAERIGELLRQKPRLDLADMERIQGDLLSPQARRFLAVLRPLIPHTPAGEILSQWDLRYDAASRGAVLFESFYARLLREVFGRGLFGKEAWDALVSSTSILVIFFHRFDAAVLGGDPAWFPEGREALFRRILAEVTAVPLSSVRPWGRQRQITMRNLLLAGSLPRWLCRLARLDYGPIALEGGRATIVQSAIYRNHDRSTAFAPSYRYITDLGRDEIRSALAGGPSGRPFSPWYRTDLCRWLKRKYKTLLAETDGG